MQPQKASHTFGPFYDKNSEILILEWQFINCGVKPTGLPVGAVRAPERPS